MVGAGPRLGQVEPRERAGAQTGRENRRQLANERAIGCWLAKARGIQFTTHDSQLTIQNSRLTNHNSQLTTHDSRLTTHDSRFTIHD